MSRFDVAAGSDCVHKPAADTSLDCRVVALKFWMKATGGDGRLGHAQYCKAVIL